jgi:hypothetical protein
VTLASPPPSSLAEEGDSAHSLLHCSLRSLKLALRAAARDSTLATDEELLLAVSEVRAATSILLE